MKPLTQSIIKWFIVAILCLALGFYLGIFKQKILQTSLESAKANLQLIIDEKVQLSKKIAVIEADQVIDKRTIKRLTEENKVLNEELKVSANKLYFYEKVIAPSQQPYGVQVYSFSVNSNKKTDSWDYELVLMQAQKNRRFQKGKFAVNFSFPEKDDLTIIPIKDLSETFNPKFNFKYFQTIRGTFQLPAEKEPSDVIINLSVVGDKRKQVELSYNWQALVNKNNGVNESLSDVKVVEE